MKKLSRKKLLEELGKRIESGMLIQQWITALDEVKPVKKDNVSYSVLSVPYFKMCISRKVLIYKFYSGKTPTYGMDG